MAPRGTNSDVGPVTAEKAISFISKSWLGFSKSADEDIQRIRARAKSLTDLADKKLENLRKASLNLGVDDNYGNLFPQFKGGGNPCTPLNTSQIKRSHSNPDFGNQQAQLVERQGVPKPDVSLLWRALTPRADDEDFYLKATSDAVQRRRQSLYPDPCTPLNTSQIKRSHSNPDFGNQQAQLVERQGVPKPYVSLLWRALTPRADDEDFYLKATSDAETVKSQRTTKSLAGRRIIVRDSGSKSKRGSKKTRPTAEEWEPLRRVKEGWKDWEVTAATIKSPSEFIDNLKKTQLFENVKRNLKRSSKNLDNERDVAPLDVPELLANLVRQSGPLLDQLGVRKDVADKFCDMLQKCKRKDQLPLLPAPSTDAAIATRDSGNSADELESRIASVIHSTGYQYKGGIWGEHVTKDAEHGIRNVAIVTTASLPWMTGTAVNPLFRAAYLAKNGNQTVTLLVPWLCKNDQVFVYPNNMVFESPEDQEKYVRAWLEERVGFRPDFKMIFYPGKFSQEKRSILAAGDISRFIPDREADIAVLEEPEHLNWYYHGKRWTDKFQHVVGVVHTNYLEYVKREKNGAFQAFLLEQINNWVTRIHCQKVVRLSAATQELPKSSVCNVHGVSPKFLQIGQNVVVDESGNSKFSKGAYFLGKMIWGKGYRELVDLLEKHKQELQNFSMDVYGNGEDSSEVKSAAEKLGLGINFHQGRDHADASLHSYKVFINPSVSDVVCTTTAEALAMGKIVVCADHPSNEFFRSFPNCLTYKSSEEFVEKVNEAMAADPIRLSPDQRFQLSWEAATDRFIECAELDQPSRKETKTVAPGDIIQNKSMPFSMSTPRVSDLVDNGLAIAHFWASGNEVARLVSGALPGTMNYDLQQSKDLHLPPPTVESPAYGW